MDSSISLEGKDFSLEDYVLGRTPPVAVRKLRLEKLLLTLIEHIKSNLKYLPCFKPLAELLNGGILPGCATRRTDVGLVKFPDGISERTKAIEFQVLEEGDAGTTSVRKSFLMTDEGELLIWSAVYNRPVSVEFTGGRDEVAKESIFKRLSEEEFRDAFSQSHLWPRVEWQKVVVRAIERLRYAFNECIEEREKYLQSMRWCLDALDTVHFRMDVTHL
ncbi:MAG: hypothetical protein AAB358_03030 [Patescibacteria group bacterium]